MSHQPASQPAPLADAHQRREILANLGRSLLVEAAAGTGKTRVLVDRVIETLRSGRGQLASMVVVTFTEKAAGELKLRIRQRLEEASRGDLPGHDARREGQPPHDGWLRQALEQFEDAHVSTIHGFCSDLLREYPVEAGVDPDFEVLGDGMQQARLFDRVFSSWFDRRQHQPPEALRRVLRRRAPQIGPFGGGGPLGGLRAAARRLAEHRDLTHPWRAPTEDPVDLAAEVEALCRQVARAAQLAEELLGQGRARRRQVIDLLTFADELAGREAGPLSRERAELLEARLWSLPRALRRMRRSLGKGRALAPLAAAVSGLLEQAERFCRRTGAELAPALREELAAMVARYEAEKRLVGRLDFADLLLRARDLLVGHPAVRAELQRRFSQIYVDEFQDTDPLQAEILLLLCADDPAEGRWDAARPVPGKLFIVGDPKQSIYRFRRAEVELYQRIKGLLVSRGDVEALELTTCFRSVPDLQRAVNAAFAPLITADARLTQPGYVPLSPYRDATHDQPALVALPLGSGDRPLSSFELRGREPQLVGGWIEWVLAESGWRVPQRDGVLGPIAPHQVCVLFRKLRSYGRDLVAPYAASLERRGVPHVVLGGRSLFARDESDAVRVALRVVEWPADELSVYATLRGPLFGIDDETLLLFRRSGGRFDARRPGEPAHGREVLPALELLGALHLGRNHRTLDDTLQRLLGATRCLAGFAMRPGGEMAVRSLLRLQQLARQFQRGEGLSFRAFVEYLDEQADALLAQGDNPLAEEGEGGVRMMSVHRAKGLEFPVVILADATARVGAAADGPGAPQSVADRAAGLFATEICGCRPLELLARQAEEAERENAEELRLLYVAATRARDVLAVPAVPGETVASADGWLGPLQPVLQSARHLAGEAPGCPPPRRGSLSFAGAVAPGLHEPQAGAHRVVWWDRELLPLDPPEAKPLRDFELLDGQGPAAAQSREAFGAWEATRARRLEAAGRPRCRVLAATAAAHDEEAELLAADADDHEVEIAHAGAPPGAVLIYTPAKLPPGVSPRRFGSFVHGMLEHLDLRRCVAAGAEPAADGEIANHLRQVALICGRMHNIDAAAQALGVTRVGRALAHPLMQRAGRAQRLFREVPVALRAESAGATPPLIEGIVDLAFLEGEGEGDEIVVVDYKTDAAPLPEQVAAYQRQVGLYLEAITRATSHPASGWLLFV